MRKFVVVAVVLSIVLNSTHSVAEATDELTGLTTQSAAKFIAKNASVEDPAAYNFQLLEELNKKAKARIPLVQTLDSSFDRKLSTMSMDQIVKDGPDKIALKVHTISPNGLLSPEEKIRFFNLLEANGRTMDELREGKFEVIFHFPEDLERAQLAREMRQNLGKEALLIEVTESMALHFNKISKEAEKSFFSRSLHKTARAIADSTVFLKDTIYSALSMGLKGEFKKYIDTVYIQPSKKDDKLALVFTGIQGTFSSFVFWGLNMDASAFTGFLATGIFSTLILSRYWKTVNNVLKTDIRNPLKQAPVWREVFARVLALGGTTTASQFAMGTHLQALHYLPTEQVAFGNAATIGLGEAYYSTKRNRVLTPEAATVIALYSYVLMSLPSRAIAQYAESINFSGVVPGGDKLDVLWHALRGQHFDFFQLGVMEFTGVSLIVLGSYVLFTEILKRKAKAAELIARDGFFRYLWKTKIKKETLEGSNKLQKPDAQAKRAPAQRSGFTAQQLIEAARVRDSALSCARYFAR